ncbi:MAG: cytochrome c oxidase subunit 3 [Cyclobacteriaceae bacterium]|jgi:cytochrome c oxidase subunit 3|nr:cytochrome c oxidase subunit 3 [Flammeovirgaceae bacterium]MCZ8021476.1 cytochrome c oxidase subunit 3 [Cytophagales bacterium]MCZ8327760.1 cytochrome c oxidase subunit 3 [Cyclobacteriaceae bacterium]
MAEIKIIEEAKKPLAMNPRKFALWLFIVSVCMIFASLTSAYIVRQAEGNWFVFQLPGLFTTTTVMILLSSFTMHWAYVSAKKNNVEMVKTALVITAILGFGFLVGQFLAWGKLVEQNVHFVGNPSGSFVYVLSGLHGLHIVSGVVVLIVALVAAFRMQIHSKNMNLIEMCATYWHFLDVLWLYLFLFMLFNR